uniref:Uncharacterized protein n=1 Tax=Globisporangium ultimum (strain ATCC 200006 / CBS 805.95 / DAOM BR144) TaxID=431595 RepID=K3X722_GLOUD
MAAKAPFVSSLGNVFGGDATAPSASAAASSATVSTAGTAPIGLLPTSSSIQWPSAKTSSNGGSAFGNPFGAASTASTAANDSGVNAERTTMMSAFSGLGLALDAQGGVVATASSAQQLLAKKNAEKQLEEQLAAERTAKREALKKQQEAARNAPRPVTALSQALGAFDHEIEQSELLTKKASSSSATMSRRARQKKEKARERAEGYDGKRSAKSTRDVKRFQRKEKYKH